MSKITAKAVEFPNNENVAFTERFETGGKAWAIIALARSMILI
jgi:hypothetical protein